MGGNGFDVKKAAMIRVLAAGFVDQLGILTEKAKELEIERARYAEAVREQLAKLLAMGAEPESEAAEFRATLVPQKVTPVIDPRAFKRVCPSSLFYRCVTVKVGEARKALGEVALAKLSPPEPGTPRLLVERKEAAA